MATITARLSHLERERERESLKGSRNRGKLVRAAWKNEIKIPWKSWLTSATVLETFNPAGHCEMPLARFSYSFFPDDVTARKWKGKQKEGNLASFHTATSLLILPPLFPSHILHRVLITNFHTAPRKLDENGSSNSRIRIRHGYAGLKRKREEIRCTFSPGCAARAQHAAGSPSPEDSPPGMRAPRRAPTDFPHRSLPSRRSASPTPPPRAARLSLAPPHHAAAPCHGRAALRPAPPPPSLRGESWRVAMNQGVATAVARKRENSKHSPAAQCDSR